MYLHSPRWDIVGVLTTDGQARSASRLLRRTEATPTVDAHVVKLRAMIGRCDGWMGLLR